MGVLHARHRPLQAFLLFTAGRGALAGTLAPAPELLRLDETAHRLDLVRRGRAAAERVDEVSREKLRAYLDGFAAGLERSGLPFELRALLARFEAPDIPALMSGLLLSAYLGLAEGQARMERLLVEAVQAGASTEVLAQMFAPHLDGWSPETMRRLDLGRDGGAHAAVGGSNAWAVAPERTREGRAILAGDPHLGIGQLPALFFEMTVRLPNDYWLGATIPGLPSVAVGRNRRVAWSGTFAVADNVDAFVEEIVGSRASGDPIVERRVDVARRGLGPMSLAFYETPRGTLDGAPRDGAMRAVSWSGAERPEEAIVAYFALLEADSAAAAERALEGAHTLSLHFVLADRGGDVRYKQVGCIPRRTGGWSGLYPSARDDHAWDGFYRGARLPSSGPHEGMVVTANEARRAPDGGVLSTFGLAPYRRDRIRALLRDGGPHDIASMQRIQLDLFSRQAERLRPRLLAALDEGPLRAALAAWDLRYSAGSIGAHAFEIAYRAALRGLASVLGGAWFEARLESTEVRIWWSAALDRALSDDAIWAGPVGAAIAQKLDDVRRAVPARWGDVQRLELRHLMFGGLPDLFGFDRGPYPLVGSMATVCQGDVVQIGAGRVHVGPAYRFVTDLGEDCAYTSLPGGIDGSRFSPTYDRWLDDHLAGRSHRLAPPPV